MFKKFAILAALSLTVAGCYYVGPGMSSDPMAGEAFVGTPYSPVNSPANQPKLRRPSSVVVCRAKQCAAAKLSMSREYIYNSLLQMLDSNARQKALICAGDANSHSCTEQYVSLPVTIGVTPGFVYLDDVKITEVSISEQNTTALNLILNWGVSNNGQTPVCRPSKTVLFVKNVNNALMEDNGYECKFTTTGVTTVKTLFAIDYVDLDYGYIGGFYSIGLSGPTYGGGSGYMIIRLPKDVTLAPTDFISEEVAADRAATQAQKNALKKAKEEGKVPNVASVIKYNHAAAQYEKNKKRAANAKRAEEISSHYKGVQVFPVSQSAD